MNFNLPVSAWQPLHVQFVQSGAELEAVASEWDTLWAEADGLVFQHHDWVSAWWNTLPANHSHTLRVGLLWHGTRLRAVLPLVITRRKGVRVLEWAAIACTDYPDLLAAPNCPVEKLHELWAAVIAQGGYDVVRLIRLLPDARARAMLAAAELPGLPLQVGVRSEESYRVAGDFSGDGSWLATQSKKTRQNYRRGWKMLEENGNAQFRLVDPSTEPLAPFLERFSELKGKWLLATNRHSELFLDDTRVVAALVEVLHRLGILRIFVIERDGETIAISINFVQRGTMMALLTTYDPAFERASPGALLIMDYINWSAGNGIRTVDFLCGGERFKQRFATTAVTLETLIAPRTMVGHAALLADRVRQRLGDRHAAAIEATEDGADTLVARDGAAATVG